MTKNKPECRLIGENGNIFNLMGIAADTLLKANGNKAQVSEMYKKVFASRSYDEALSVIGEYVKIV